MDVCLRKRDERDADFLLMLFGEVKTAELHAGSWPRQARERLMAQQFIAFEQSVQSRYPSSEDHVIVHASKRIGRLQINSDFQSIRVTNLSLLPAYRNKGIGSRILREIIREADATDREVLFEVDKVNPAVTLYRRLGFEACKEDTLKYVMRYAPSPDRSGEGDIPNV